MTSPLRNGQTTSLIRLNKLLADAGLCSRRKADAWIQAGCVAVNGRVVTEVGAKADPAADRITVNGRPLKLPETAKLVAFYKPRRVMVTRRDPEGRKTIYDLLPPALQAFKYVGRLDYDSEGLLFLTNSGDLAERIAHPRHHIRKRYVVWVSPAPAEAVLARFRKGTAAYAPIEVSRLPWEGKGARLEMVLGEGRNRQIRRMCESVGLLVRRLTRVAIGSVELESLAPGAWRHINPELLM